ncbi:3-phosphoglycerate dehydrogenase [Pseudomonas daroniae]|uniref:3-phosphoglycerate dehydrogenase n=1 Tax=Phytopseudomonas daroniae TaxID=2487519 RepID=A0A4Q9QJA7_9GAMM|nr:MULTISPECIES: D-2-hydroxyacid dehydrogenase family protein [Pseudomonas]TBU75734.1 3-phosphoglycerate dehydrogenase [Pseudomonas daroniae]TBU80529.1 3-phosphoglycerate dehydrogenase [Pseudomonas sp. FRB 228]TBU89646.1 3-phosphoglycerate dehydrogenase [Pseudomonas daroniae]
MHIVIPDDYQNVIRTLDCFATLGDHQVSLYHDAVDDVELLVERFADADALVLTRERTRIDEALLARLPKLKLISQTGKVSNHLDVAACTRHGVAVMEGRGSPIAPAELTWALIINARRQLFPAMQGLYAGQWQVNLGQRLAGQTLGIWGYGKIGQRLARYAQAFEMPVLVWGSETSRQAAIADGHRAAESRLAFFAESDVLSLHLRLAESTRHLVGAKDLAAMKPSALLVNTSRAELIAPGALLEALNLGRPGSAALDVFEQEPILDPNHPLLRHPAVLCTPHLGYVEREGYELYFGDAFANVQAFFAESCTLANPDVRPVRQ